MIWELRCGRYISARSIAEGEAIPRWLGIAWAMPYSHRWYCLPIPLNWIAGWSCSLYMWLRGGPHDVIRDTYDHAFRKGEAMGYARGHAAGMRLAAEAVKR